MNNPSSIREALLTKKTLLTILGAIIIGLITSGLYDLIVKPGISSMADWSYNFISIFSDKIENAPFSSAALNPTSLPDLFHLLLWTSFIPGSLFSFIFIVTFILIKRIKSADDQDSLIDNKGNNKKIIILISILSINAIIMSILLFAVFSIINKSIAIYRVFNSNLTICTPYIPNTQKLSILSDFSRMDNKSDYLKINSKLEKIAVENNIKLRRETIE